MWLPTIYPQSEQPASEHSGKCAAKEPVISLWRLFCHVCHCRFKLCCFVAGVICFFVFFFYLVKSVISIMIIHICLASTIMSLPLSSHFATSASSLHFSCLKLSTCSAILAFSSWGSCAMIACRQQGEYVRNKSVGRSRRLLGSKFELNKLGRCLRMGEMPEEKNLGEGMR